MEQLAEQNIKKDILYFQIENAEIDKSEEITQDIVLDLNKDGNIIGIKILNASRHPGNIHFKSLHHKYELQPGGIYERIG